MILCQGKITLINNKKVNIWTGSRKSSSSSSLWEIRELLVSSAHRARRGNRLVVYGVE